MHIKPDDVLVVHLVVVGNIRASEVEIGAESLNRQVPKSRGKLSGRDSLYFLNRSYSSDGSSRRYR